MLKSKLCLAVIILAHLFISNVSTMPSQGLDIQSMLQALQKQMQQDKEDQPTLVRVEDGENDNEVHFGSLKREDLFPSQVDVVEDKPIEYNSPRDNEDSLNRVEKLAKQVLEQVLQERNRQQLVTSRPKQRLDINSLLNNLGGDNDDQDSDSEDSDEDEPNLGSLSDYSKVYVVLNSEAIKNSKNLDKLNDLLSSLLSAPSSRNNRKKKNYKGFALNGINRRARDNSRGSDERPHGHGGRGSYGHGGGGGGGNSRTAIPYIKNRGDVYEKED